MTRLDRLRAALDLIARADHPDHPVFGQGAPGHPRTEAQVAQRMSEIAREALEYDVVIDDPLSAYCLGSYEEMAREAEAWCAKWPKHCKACHGWGMSSYEESHGFKGGGTETITDPCGALPSNVCHRCGESGLFVRHADVEEGAGPCSACGWDYEDGMPQP